MGYSQMVPYETTDGLKVFPRTTPELNGGLWFDCIVVTPTSQRGRKVAVLCPRELIDGLVLETRAQSVRNHRPNAEALLPNLAHETMLAHFGRLDDPWDVLGRMA